MFSLWPDFVPLQLSSLELPSLPSPTLLLGVASLLLASIFLIDRWIHFRLFVRCGIDGPKPGFIFGNLKDMDDGNGTKEGFLNLEKKFGRTFGVFFGSIPHILTSDPDVIKCVFVKDFHLFPNRRIVLPPPESARNVLSLVHYERWRPMRSIVTPFFSLNRIRKMTPTFNTCVGAFVEIVGEKLNKDGEAEFDVIPFYQRLAVDAVSLCAFGLEVNSQRQHHYILDAALRLVRGINRTSLKIFLCLICQRLVPFVQFIDKIFNSNVVDPMQSAARKLIRTRKEEARLHPEVAKKRDDFVGLLFESEVESLAHVNDPVRGMTEAEISMQAATMVVGGFETTSRTLSYITYLLAKHQDVQESLFKEITSILKSSNESPSAEQLSQMEYLEMVIFETLRLCPPAPFGVTSRTALQDSIITDASGREFFVKKDVSVSLNMWALHYNPEVWPEPEKFDPSRFSKSARSARDPAYFVPFGFGLRNCIGQRFALAEIKTALATIVRRFQILPSEATKELNPKMMDFGIENVVVVKYHQRS